MLANIATEHLAKIASNSILQRIKSASRLKKKQNYPTGGDKRFKVDLSPLPASARVQSSGVAITILEPPGHQCPRSSSPLKDHRNSIAWNRVSALYIA